MEKKIGKEDNLYTVGLKIVMEERNLNAIEAYGQTVKDLSRMQGFNYNEHVTNLNLSLIELVGRKQAMETINKIQKKLKIKRQ